MSISKLNTHENRIAVVTGAANGIGQAFAVELARRGAKVVIADLADGEETLKQCHATGGEAVAVHTDLTDAASVAALAERARNDFGSADILVHCAGIYPLTPFSEITWDEWRLVMSVNLDSLFHLGKAFLPAMTSQGWGRMVSMASTTFHTGFGGFCHYTASKGGVIGFTRTLAAEVGDRGVTVNAIAPGLVRTATTEHGPQNDFFGAVADQQAIKRTEVPQDMTGALAFLTSDEASFITGQTLVVDGGWVRA
jgi:NAD(P)-dependent dehydrogenase (short-subunit alcohol dehydrogenase family)